MEKETIALESQSLFDIAVQSCGAVEAVLDLAVANNISITDALHPGQLIDNTDIKDNRVFDYYRTKGLTPASGDVEVRGGIGYMAVGIDFIVS
ncbi:MAG: hypothetical protein E6767_20385 [Dysgonomonas sp.]|nr:hypothetical protein [Dysgonomonas sp.]